MTDTLSDTFSFFFSEPEPTDKCLDCGTEDRIHRIGQEHKTLYVDLVCSGSIDDRIAQSLANKRDAVEDFKHKVSLSKDDPEAMRKLLEAL